MRKSIPYPSPSAHPLHWNPPCIYPNNCKSFWCTHRIQHWALTYSRCKELYSRSTDSDTYRVHLGYSHIRYITHARSRNRVFVYPFTAHYTINYKTRLRIGTDSSTKLRLRNHWVKRWKPRPRLCCFHPHRIHVPYVGKWMGGGACKSCFRTAPDVLSHVLKFRPGHVYSDVLPSFSVCTSYLL